MAKMTRAVIEMNYSNAMRQADRIAAVSDNMRRLAGQELGETIQNLAANWKGCEASLYLQKGDRLMENILRTAGELQTAAQKIRTEARRVRDADLQALEIVQS